jgi:pimeloyl-ACP methyl ester carboxylesterase
MTGRRLVYLHGFASSARSSKAAYLASRAGAGGLTVEAPDLNAPDFETLTMTRMIEQVRQLLAAGPAEPVTLVGSSLGALVALFAAEALVGDRHPRAPDSLVLMAPAVDLVHGLTELFGPEGLAEWERTGRYDVFHYGDGAMRTLGWSFFADARGYDPWAVATPLPTLVLQGTRDELVDADRVRRWAAGRSTVTLRTFDDGHQLLASLDAMWDEMRRFLTVSA